MIVNVNSDQFEEEVIQADELVIADFYSESCIPCKMLTPILYELDAQYEGKIKIVKIKVGTEFELAQRYEIHSTPTVLFFRKGRELESFTGYKDKDSIEEIINSYL